MGGKKDRQSVLFYKKLEKHKETPQEKLDRERRNEKLAELDRLRIEDLLRKDGFSFRLGQYFSTRQYIESEGMVNRKFIKPGTTGYVCSSISVLSQKYLVTFSTDGIRLWDYKSTSLLDTVLVNDVHDQTSMCGASRPTNAEFIGCRATEVTIYSIVKNRVVVKISPQALSHGHDRAVVTCAYHPTKPTFFITGSQDSTVIIWKLVNDENSVKILDILPAHPEGVTSVSFFPTSNDHRIVTSGGHHSPEIKVWEIASIIEDDDSTLNDDRIKYRRILPTIFNPETTMDVLSTGNIQRAFSSIQNTRWSFPNDGQRDTEILIPTKELPYEIPELPEIPADDDILDDDDLLPEIDLTRLLNPSLSITNSTATLNATSITPSKVLKSISISSSSHNHHHTACVNAVAICPKTFTIASAGSDGQVLFWDPNTVCRKRIDCAVICHNDAITSLCYSPDSKILASCDVQGFIKTWNTETLENVFTLYGYVDSVRNVQFDSSSTYVLSSGSNETVAWCVVPSVPDKPLTPVVATVECHSVTLTWDPPLANGSALLRYEVVIIEEGDAVPVPRYISKDATSASIDKIEAGCHYEFKIAARNSIGLGPYSPRSAQIETLSFAPSKPIAPPLILKPSPTSCRIKWTPPRKNGTEIEFYHFKCIPEVSSQNALSNESHRATTLSCRVHVSEIEEQMKCLDREENEKEERLRAMKERRIHRILNESGRDSKRIELAKHKERQRQQREEMNKLGLRGNYKANAVLRRKLGRIDVARSFVIPNLLPGTVYQYQVAGENRMGIGEYSDSSDYSETEKTAPYAPDAPIICNVQSYSVDIRFVPPRENGSEIVQYTIVWKQNTTETTETLLRVNALHNEYRILNVKPGANISVKLCASNFFNNKLHDSPYSSYSDDIKTVSTAPDVIEPCKFVEPEASALTIVFNPPCDNGEAITCYSIACFRQERLFDLDRIILEHEFTITPEQLTQSDNSLSSHYRIKRLCASSSYVVRLCATNAIGKAEFSAQSRVGKTLSKTFAATIQRAPEILAMTPSTVTLRWTAPENDGGDSIVAYVIEHSVNGSTFPAVKNRHRVGPDVFETTLKFLKTKYVYKFRVAAINTVGISEFSAATDSTRAPSLAEYTITQYYATRPNEEHVATRKIQKLVREHLVKAPYYRCLKKVIPSWQIL